MPINPLCVIVYGALDWAYPLHEWLSIARSIYKVVNSINRIGPIMIEEMVFYSKHSDKTYQSVRYC